MPDRGKAFPNPPSRAHKPNKFSTRLRESLPIGRQVFCHRFSPFGAVLLAAVKLSFAVPGVKFLREPFCFKGGGDFSRYQRALVETWTLPGETPLN